MKILFTGASSFTGMWFIEELVKAGHNVTCTFLRSQYDGLRKQRVERILPHITPHFNCPFGSDNFLNLTQQNFDLLCHHAADVTDYKSPHFNYLEAAKKNTHRLPEILQHFNGRIVLTGSLFERGEGEGDENLRALSPYGLSKTLTSEIFHFHTSQANIPLSKFVIPNPFGPFEEKRFTHYLISTWLQNRVATVTTPLYIRDNIFAPLLAKSYAAFCSSNSVKINPSYRPESQGDFAKRIAEEMRQRTTLPCELNLKEQTEFQEPKTRINKDLITLPWDEAKAWDQFASYYQLPTI